MMKKLLIILVLAIGFTACKNNHNNACGTQTCTASFAYFGVTFTDSEGKPTAIKDVKLFNVRTGKTFSPPFSPPAIDFVAGFVLVASDENKSQFSTKGDDVQVTASNSAGQTKQVTIQISGGCNCHVEKISGPETVKFD